MSVSSLSSRRAVSSGFSPSTSMRPAGISHTGRPMGWRYCRISRIRPLSSIATIPTASLATAVSRINVFPSPRVSLSRRMDTIFPAYSVLLSNTFGIIIQNLPFLSDVPRLCQPIIISHYITLSFPCHFFLPLILFTTYAL